ncbi:MAG TPA: hypothetical protein VED01_24085 [Burkholderiales bacterium]|nr:hypothetical protein [Burkholderiales bacterium]
MKSLLTVGLAALLIGSAPAFADPWKDESGHGRHGKHWNKHAEKHWKKQHKHWEKQHKHWAKHHRHHHDRHVVYAPPAVVEHHVVHRRVVEHHYPVPVVAAPAPGVHVVLPSLYVPF